MAAPTRLVMQGYITQVLGDTQITNADIQNALNTAITEVRGDLLVVGTATTPAAAATVAVPTGFVAIYSVELAGVVMPDSAWRIRESSSPLIVFDQQYFAGAPAGTLTITGGIFQAVLAADGDSLYIDPGYIMARALVHLHSSRGGTESDYAAWHQREHEKWMAFAERRYPEALLKYGLPPGARYVRSILTGA